MRSILGPIVGAVMAALAATCNEGCKDVQSPSVGDVYAAELQACVAKAKSKEESRSCRDQVDEKYGVCRQFPNACLPGK